METDGTKDGNVIIGLRKMRMKILCTTDHILSSGDTKNRELKTERSLGYYDNLLEAYIITDRRSKVTDVVKEYQESEE